MKSRSKTARRRLSVIALKYLVPIFSDVLNLGNPLEMLSEWLEDNRKCVVDARCLDVGYWILDIG